LLPGTLSASRNAILASLSLALGANFEPGLAMDKPASSRGGFALGQRALGQSLSAVLELFDQIDVAWTDLVAQTALDAPRKCVGSSVIRMIVAATEPEHFLWLQRYRARVLAETATDTCHGWLIGPPGLMWNRCVRRHLDRDEFDAVHRTRGKAKLATGARGFNHRMHELRCADDRIGRTCLDAQIATDASVFVDHGLAGPEGGRELAGVLLGHAEKL
jgi:hypothetical protein